MLSEEEVKKIKEEIIKQINSWHATDKQKEQAKEQIEAMPKKELEDFLIKNKLITQQGKEKQECPFCLIIQEKIPAYKIDENKESLAILEINPLSPGHTLIVPREHAGIDKIPSGAFFLAKKISEKIKVKLKPKEIKTETAEVFGHGIINIIPVYEGKLERKKASGEELKELQSKLTIKEKEEIPKEIKTEEKQGKKSEQLEKAPRRIP